MTEAVVDKKVFCSDSLQHKPKERPLRLVVRVLGLGVILLSPVTTSGDFQLPVVPTYEASSSFVYSLDYEHVTTALAQMGYSPEDIPRIAKLPESFLRLFLTGNIVFDDDTSYEGLKRFSDMAVDEGLLTESVSKIEGRSTFHIPNVISVSILTPETLNISTINKDETYIRLSFATNDGEIHTVTIISELNRFEIQSAVEVIRLKLNNPKNYVTLVVYKNNPKKSGLYMCYCHPNAGTYSIFDRGDTYTSPELLIPLYAIPCMDMFDPTPSRRA